MLAEHEYQVAEWYYDRKLYFSAISRYEYLLKNFTHFSRKEEAIEKLILIYKLFNFTDRAKELETL